MPQVYNIEFIVNTQYSHYNLKVKNKLFSLCTLKDLGLSVNLI